MGDAYSCGSEQTAYDLLRSGRFTEAAAHFAQRKDSEALRNRAWIAHFHDRDLERAGELIAESIATAVSSTDDILARALGSVVAVSLGKKSARIDIADLLGAETPDVVSQATYWLAYAAFLDRDFARAENWLTFHEPSSAAMRARFLTLRGSIAAAKEQDFSQQAKLTEEALATLERDAPSETYLIAKAAHILSHLLREVAMPNAVARLERIDTMVEFTEGTAEPRFHTQRALAWTRAMHGDLGGGLETISRATIEASRPILRIYGFLDYAAIAIFANQRTCAYAAFNVAHGLAEAMGWKSQRGDHNIVAVALAAEVAAELGRFEDAERYLNLADELLGLINPEYAVALASGDRLHALLSAARALAYADRDRVLAIRHAGDAHATFARIGYDLRAGRMALLLHQLTRKDQWRAKALTHLERFPNNPFSRLLEPGRNQRTLTKRQLDTLRLVCLGYEDSRIAMELGIAYGTVRQHVSRCFSFFGAQNRAELIVRATNYSQNDNEASA